VTPEDLQERLQAAVQAEEFGEAARLRDELQQLMLDAEMALLCANREFYAAFQACDADRMTALWLDADRSCCVHPAAPPIHGSQAVADSWRTIFGRRGELQIECLKPSVVISGTTGRVVCYERVDAGVPLVAVNLFESTSSGWRMWFHQAGIVDPVALRDGA